MVLGEMVLGGMVLGGMVLGGMVLGEMVLDENVRSLPAHLTILFFVFHIIFFNCPPKLLQSIHPFKGLLKLDEAA